MSASARPAQAVPATSPNAPAPTVPFHDGEYAGNADGHQMGTRLLWGLTSTLPAADDEAWAAWAKVILDAKVHSLKGGVDASDSETNLSGGIHQGFIAAQSASATTSSGSGLHDVFLILPPPEPVG